MEHHLLEMLDYHIAINCLKCALLDAVDTAKGTWVQGVTAMFLKRAEKILISVHWWGWGWKKDHTPKIQFLSQFLLSNPTIFFAPVEHSQFTR